MFERVNDYLVVNMNNLRALEAVSEYLYLKLKTTYFIQIETFPNLSIYRIVIPVNKRYDENIKKKILEFLEIKRVQLMEERVDNDSK